MVRDSSQSMVHNAFYSILVLACLMGLLTLITTVIFHGESDLPSEIGHPDESAGPTCWIHKVKEAQMKLVLLTFYFFVNVFCFIYVICKQPRLPRKPSRTPSFVP